MAYSTVTGTVATFGWGVLPGCEITFVPSGNATISDGVSPAVFATAPVVVTPDSQGVFVALLQATDSVTPAIWYTIRLTWLNGADVPVGKDFPDWKLYVPAEGGDLSDLLAVPWNPTLAWYGVDAPTGTPVANTLWLDSDSTNADLLIWSN